jgi:PIN domain nuclease of toxin-antitoxin system
VSPSPILLDTCAALWTVDDAISQAASDALTEAHRADQPTYVSPITAWEVGLLASRGRFSSALTPLNWFNRLLALPNVHLSDMPPDALFASSFLPGSPPRDPADRVIVATAREFGFTVMTRDRTILEYAKDGHVFALPC